MANTLSKKSYLSSRPEIVCIFYKDFRLIRVNAAWRRFFGLMDEAIVGRSLFEFVPQLDHDTVRRDLLNLGASKRSASYRHPAGFGHFTLGWIDWDYRVTLDRNGKVIVYDAVGRWVPERNGPKSSTDPQRGSDRRLL